MPSFKLRIIVGLLVVVAANLSIAGNLTDPPEVTSLLVKGKRLLRIGDWFEASQVFEELAGRYPNSRNIDKFVFYRAKAKYYSGNIGEAIAGFTYFLSRFSDSKELPYVHFFLGNAYYRQGDVDKAVKSYLESFRLTDDKRLSDLVTASLQAAFKNASSINLGKADFEVFPLHKRCSLVNLLAEVLVQKDRLTQADRIRSYCSESSNLAESHVYGAERDKDQLEIAMVLPFSGELHSFGEDIYDGAVVAAEIYRSEAAGILRLTPFDTKGDPINAARIIRDLSHSSPLAAIGPLASEEAAVASATLGCSSFPMLVPAATRAGLTMLSNTSFQLSPNIDLEGMRIAEYAVRNLHADSAVVITSTSVEPLQMARAFVDRFRQLGGIVVAIEYYSTRDKDFGPCIRDVKAILLSQLPDSVFYVNEEGDTLDSDGIPAYVDCLFLPGNPQQIRLLLPQINFYNLNGYYLGSDSWGDEAILKLGDDITKGAIFSSPFLMDETSQEYLRFAAAYDARFGHQPNRLSRLGYDAVRLMTRAISSGATSREKLTEELKRVRDYNGASGKITFGIHRENIEMPLFRIMSEKAVPLLSPTDSTSHDGE